MRRHTVKDDSLPPHDLRCALSRPLTVELFLVPSDQSRGCFLNFSASGFRMSLYLQCFFGLQTNAAADGMYSLHIISPGVKVSERD